MHKKDWIKRECKKILGEIVGQAIDFINGVKDDDKNYLKYLEMTKNQFNLNEFLVDLVNRNPEFVKTEFFRKKKKKDVYKLVDDFKKGRLPQQGDNLTIMGNPIALLMKAVGENPLEENIFDVEEDAIQCYTERFMDGENLAAFRSPHNSPNNILHFHNIKSEKISKYFPNLGENIIVINLIGTDAQARGSGFDEDSDFVFVTNQSEVVELARQASPANGTAHATGTTNVSANKNWGLKRNEPHALVNELKPEIIVRDGQPFIVNGGDPAFTSLKQGDIVFNGEQSEALLKNGYVTGSHGKLAYEGAHSLGTAFSNGTGKFNVGSSGSKSSSSSKKKSSSSSSKSSSNSSSSSSKSNSSSDSSNDKEETKETLDWIETKLDRIKRKIDELDTTASSTYRTWSKRNEAYVV